MVAGATVATAQQGGVPANTTARVVALSTSKQLFSPVPGHPQRLNSLPVSLAVSPDGRYVVAVNAGYGTLESGYMQSLAVLDTATGSVRDVPETRTLIGSAQTLFSGLAFSADGTRVYASMASMSDPGGEGKNATGSGVAVYGFHAGVLTPQRVLRLPSVPLAGGHTTELPGGGSVAAAFPAAIALVSGRPHETLLVAENLSDTVSLLDAQTGALLHRFDLSKSAAVPGVYPVAVAVSGDGRRAFIALWNASEVVELDLEHGRVERRLPLLKPASPTAPGTHPCALLLDERAHRLYVALANRDAVAAVDVGTTAQPRLRVAGFVNTRLPGQTYFGAEPDALTLNADGSRLYVANMGSDAVAVVDTRALRGKQPRGSFAHVLGFVPTELMPTALASAGGKLYVATGKAEGTGPNPAPQVITPAMEPNAKFHRPFTYAPTLLHGSLATLDEAGLERDLAASTETVLASNRMKSAQETIPFASGRNPIRHVIYILKENRTYDQVFGDLAVNGRRVGNGDPSLTMYGATITPNQHKLALQFGVLDNFFDSGEVSGSGHTWSMAGIGTDYLEKTWQINYRGERANTERSYDYEGMVAEGYPLLEHIADVNEPASGYIFGNFAAHGKSILHFGEYVLSTFCTDKEAAKVIRDSQAGAMSGEQAPCARAAYGPGEALPEVWGGGTNLWPWAIPRLLRNVPTKPELVGHFVVETPNFNLKVPDQIRVNIFLRHLEQWKRDRAAGHDTMPAYIMLRLPNDHTAGTTVGEPTPRASVADNDLAVGRAVEAVSHSAFWEDTAFFILEDDAQNGGDHVDAHRSTALVVSKYAPRAQGGPGVFVDSRFYTTVSMIRTMEMLLGVPPMNNNDAFCSVMAPLFTGAGDQPAFAADFSNRDNGLIYQANKAGAPGAAESGKMDFSHADRADAAKLNMILWRDAMGEAPPPAVLLEKHRKRRDEDD